MWSEGITHNGDIHTKLFMNEPCGTDAAILQQELGQYHRHVTDLENARHRLPCARISTTCATSMSRSDHVRNWKYVFMFPNISSQCKCWAEFCAEKRHDGSLTGGYMAWKATHRNRFLSMAKQALCQWKQTFPMWCNVLFHLSKICLEAHLKLKVTRNLVCQQLVSQLLNRFDYLSRSR